MHIENDRSEQIKMSGSDNDVNEATAALKGLLGISSPVVESSTDTNPAKKEQESPKKSKKKKANKTKKKKDNAPTKKNEKKGKLPKKKDTSEKFAWSAFQASPDASSLPIPAFSPPAKSKRTLNEQAVSGLPETTNLAVPVDTGKSEEVASSNTEGAVGVEVKGAVVETKSTDSSNLSQETETKKEEPEEPVSSTGINLAALASPSSPPQTSPPNPAPGPSTAVTPNQVPFPSNVPSPQYQQQHPVYNNTSPQQQQPQVQFVTIQVQVPPVLLPGRQMVVVQNSRRNLRTYFTAVNCFNAAKHAVQCRRWWRSLMVLGRRADPSNTSKTTMDYKTEWLLTGETAFLGSLECTHNTRALRREMAPPQQSTKHSLLAL
jgi:hypothetical protein